MNRILSLVQAAGPVGAVLTVLDRSFRSPTSFLADLRTRLAGRAAVEIGGPSPKFMPGGVVPVYDVLASIDNVTFAPETIWEGTLGATYEPVPGVRGQQHIADATAVGDIGPCDVVLSCHVIEHLANPIRGLREWRRILRPGGVLVLVAPHGRYSFDRRRPLTTLHHLVEDFERGTAEDDQSHAAEVLALHDLRRDPGLSSRAELERRLADNARLRTMHHHVFDEKLVGDILAHAGFHVERLLFRRPFDIIAVASRG